MTTFTDATGRMPDPIKRAIEHYDTSHVRRGDISVTELIDSPLMFWLRKNRADQLMASYQSRMFALYGSVMASILEKFGGELAEVRGEIVRNGVTISGSADLAFDKGALVDYKFTSVFVAKDGGNSRIVDHWTKQVNLYRIMLPNHAVDRLSIAMILRDWGPRYRNEVPEPFVQIDVPKWSVVEAEGYIQERLALFDGVISRNEMPAQCSDEERWLSDFAVTKVGLKKAVKAGFQTRKEAQAYINGLKGDTSIYAVRDAKPKRCAEYCDFGACGLCPYYKPENESED